MSAEDQLQEPLLERLSASPGIEDKSDSKSQPSASKKRKRAGDAESNYVAQKTRKYESDLSLIELEDKYIPGMCTVDYDYLCLIKFSAKAIQDTTSWEKPRILDNLPGFLEKFAGNSTKLWSASKKNGAPHTIIVSAAGLRAADISRVVRKFQTKDATVAKLFAKHIKLADSIKFLKSTRTGIAVGTPTRLKDLMDDGALAVDRLERIVIDASHIDVKKRGILDMKETQSVFQCLHSQCATASFGPSLHHAISQCLNTGTELIFGVLPARNRGALQRREAEYLAGKKQVASGSAGLYPTQSAGFPTQCSYYATQSVVNPFAASATASPKTFLLRRSDPTTTITITTPTEPVIANRKMGISKPKKGSDPTRAERKAKKRKLEDAIPDLPGDGDEANGVEVNGVENGEGKEKKSKKRKRDRDEEVVNMNANAGEEEKEAERKKRRKEKKEKKRVKKEQEDDDVEEVTEKGMCM
ncbi:hypothetical protein G7Y89_g8078 [Cudoniella acicularis]|uniref:Protein CMS1 n=1 Tax=Cudoniella acicularis TaxID=354080 RepID=A0A8H4W1E2_9HELO|nr:hypothetical protein G7Y89_g8078 [Cudoniella acicularis]